jgi:hypothetical protein
MANHRIDLKVGTKEVGVTAEQLLQWPILQQSQIKCPLCETMVDIPATLEQDIKDFAQKLGSEDSIVLSIHHPPSIPKSANVQRVPVTDPERRSQLVDAWKKGKKFQE